MENEQSPTSSTPAMSKTYVAEDKQDTPRQVSPSPLVDSELTRCSQSTILEASMSNMSMETNFDSPMEMVTSTEVTVMEDR